MKIQFFEALEQQLLPPLNPRPINEQTIATMVAEFIRYGGPFQSPGVVKVGDKYRYVWGYHRGIANWRAGLETLLVRVLPDGTTEKDEMRFSLIENHNRRKEDFESTLIRINKYAEKEGCTMKEAAEFADVDPSYCSRWQKCFDRLSDEVRALAKTQNVGISVLHLLSKVKEHERQFELLNQYIAKALTRDQLAEVVASKPRKRVPKQSNLVHRHPKVDCILTPQVDATYADLREAVKALDKTIRRFEKQNIPAHLLSQLMV